MTNKHLVALALGAALFFGALLVVAQRPAVYLPKGLQELENTISVTGEATVTLKPDTALLTFGVVTDSQTAKEAQKINTSKVNEVIAAVKALGIPEQRFQTTGLSLQPRYDYSKGQQKLVGYRASVNLTVKSEEVDKVGDLVDAAVAAGANNLQGVQFTVKDLEKVKQQGIDQAVENARQQSEKIAAKLGVKIGSVKSLGIALQGENTPPVPMARVAVKAAAEDASFGPEVMPGEKEYKVLATASFAIERQ